MFPTRKMSETSSATWSPTNCKQEKSRRPGPRLVESLHKNGANLNHAHRNMADDEDDVIIAYSATLMICAVSLTLFLENKRRHSVWRYTSSQ